MRGQSTSLLSDTVAMMLIGSVTIAHLYLGAPTICYSWLARLARAQIDQIPPAVSVELRERHLTKYIIIIQQVKFGQKQSLLRERPISDWPIRPNQFETKGKRRRLLRTWADKSDKLWTSRWPERSRNLVFPGQSRHWPRCDLQASQ